MRSMEYVVALIFLSWFYPIVASQVVYLQPGDVKRVVLRSMEPWLVSFHGSVEDLKALDTDFKGIFRLAVFDIKKYGKEALHSEEPLSNETSFVVYPYGTSDTKSKKKAPAKTILAAKTLVLNFPDVTRKLPNVITTENEELRGFFQESYSATPPRFPVVYFADSTGTPALYKMLALRYSSLFNFGLVHLPSDEMMAAYSISSLPSLTGIIVQNWQENSPPRIRKIQYSEQIHGPLTYPFVARYLYIVHKYHFKDIPHASVSARDIDLDEIFMYELQRFVDEFLKFPFKSSKSEL